MIYTIGHSNVPVDQFMVLLVQHQIQMVVDVRSQPYSRHAPQFNRESLKGSLIHSDIGYLYLGDSLGGRPVDRQYYGPDGKVNYDRLAEATLYQNGLERLTQEAITRRLTVLCSEADYKKCHRHWLITRSLVAIGIQVRHILRTGEVVEASPRDFSQHIEQLPLLS